MCGQQQVVRQQGQQIAILLAALPSLPALNEIIVSDSFGQQSYNMQEGGAYMTPYRRCTDHWNYNSIVPQSWDNDRYPANPWDAVSSPYHGFVNIIRALSITGHHKIQSLYIEGRITGISHRIFLASPTDFAHVRNVFANLTTLEMTIDADWTHGYWSEGVLTDGHFAKFLHAAPLLTHLHLSLKGIAEGVDEVLGLNDEPRFDIALGFGGHFVWSHLHHFGIVNCHQIDPQHLIDFLARHRDTLRSLHLELLVLQDGPVLWADVFDDMLAREIKLDEEYCELLNDSWGTVEVVGDVIGFLNGVAENPATEY